MPANAKESQTVGDVCKDCWFNEHKWQAGRVQKFNCTCQKTSSPKTPKDLIEIIGSTTRCPLKKVER